MWASFKGQMHIGPLAPMVTTIKANFMTNLNVSTVRQQLLSWRRLSETAFVAGCSLLLH